MSRALARLRAPATAVAAALALVSCLRRDPGDAPAPAPTAESWPSQGGAASVVVEGAVIDPFGFYFGGAHVALSRLDEAGGPPVMLADAVSDTAEGFRFSAPATGRLRLDVSSERGVAPFAEFPAAEPGAVLQHVFRLAPAEVVTLGGILLGRNGLPLPAADLEFLLPAEDAAVPFSGRSAVVARVVYGGFHYQGAWFARRPHGDARFEIEVPRGFAGVVRLESRGVPVASMPWRDGDGLLEVPVDGAAFRAGLASLGVVLEDRQGAAAAGQALIVRQQDAPADVVEHLDAIVVDVSAGGLEVEDVPPGRYRVYGSAEGHASAAVEVTLGAGERRRAAARLAPTGAVLLRLPGTAALAAEDRERFAADVVVTRGDGLAVEASRRWVGDPPALLFEGLPAGAAVLRVGHDHVVAGVAPGGTVEVGLEPTERPLPQVHLQLLWSRLLPRPERAQGRVRFVRGDGIVVLDVLADFALDPEGFVLLDLPVAEGAYRLDADFGHLGRHRELVQVVAGMEVASLIGAGDGDAP